MKIILIGNGKSEHIIKWANELKIRNNEVYLVHLKGDAPLINHLVKGINVISLKYGKPHGYFLNKSSLMKIIQNISPDIVNAHYCSGYGTLARISKIHPLVISVWGSDVYLFPKKSFIHKKILIRNLKFCDCITSTSQNMIEEIDKYLSVKDKCWKIVPFGIDLDLFKYRRIKFFESGEIRIVNIKSLKKIYGLDYLIKAFKILIQKLTKIDASFASRTLLDIYGDGLEFDSLIKLRNSLGLQKQISFKGKVSNKFVPEILSKSTIFCATSINESFGVSLLEAMSVGIPVVATNVPGFQEIITHKKNGFIVESRNPENIANGLLEVLMNKGLRETIIKNAHQLVVEKYDLKRNVMEMIDVYMTTKSRGVN